MADAVLEERKIVCPNCGKDDEVFFDGSATVPMTLNEDGDHVWDLEWIEFYDVGKYVCGMCQEENFDADHFIREPGTYLP